MANENKFPTEVIDLPSQGKIYPTDSPLANGKIEIKYMTAREEDILTSQNLIKKGVVIDTLLNALIASPDVKLDDLILGDKNAIMVAARVLAYGPEYIATVTDPNTQEVSEHIFDLTDCPFKTIPEDVSLENNEFVITLPASKAEVKFKLLTGKEERIIDQELKSYKKTGTQVVPELTTRLKHSIISVNGEEGKPVIADFVNNMLSKDSFFLRQEMGRVAPDIELKQEIELGGDVVTVDIPMTVEFFWPKTAA
jgi:hypothetical protein